MNNTTDPWQTLLTSTDIFSDLCDIYTAEFLTDFAVHFNRAPQPFDLFQRVLSTAHAYVTAKAAKQAEVSKLLQNSGVHLIGAGLSARRLSYELSQISKSKRAAQLVDINLQSVLEDAETRPYATKAYRSARFRSGPQSRLDVIEELAAALEQAIGQIIALPVDYDGEKDARQRALEFVIEANSAAQKTLPKNHAMEQAARAFQPLWEAFSTVDYRRGRYHHEIGGYDCKPGNALFSIITKLDSTVAPSLAGTAIENLRAQAEVENRND
jgi:hypothetical protein